MTDWSKIVEHHGPIVWRIVRRLLNHDADAADCFQRVFVAAVELERRDAIRDWPAILRRLATARALEYLRGRYRLANRVTVMADELLADSKGREPIMIAQDGELAAQLRDALADIDARQAQVFCLACLDDASYLEIAEQLDITVNHVGVLLSRARAALRDRLGHHAPASLANEREVKS
jgi:RNA polymerase sigma-70 factor (ECF subfamily)